jgi:plastocyanin
VKEKMFILRSAVLSLIIIMLLSFAVGCASSTSTSTLPTTTAPPTSSSPVPATSEESISSASTSTNSSQTESTASGTTILLVAQKLAFNLKTITVKAGAPVTINFDNSDNGVSHNFSVYTDSSAATSIFYGKPKMGPGTTAYSFTAPTTPGTYYFQDDAYADLMNGQFIVQ